MEILYAIMLLSASVVIFWQVIFIKNLQEQNKKLLELVKEGREINDKNIKLCEEQQKELRKGAKIILLWQEQANFYRKNYVPKCPECAKDGADMEIMPNGKCERCSYEKK